MLQWQPEAVVAEAEPQPEAVALEPAAALEPAGALLVE